MRQRGLLIIVFVALSLLIPQGGEGSSLLLSPVRLFLRPGAVTAELRLTNQSEEAMHLQADIMSWEQDERGRPVYGKQKEVVIFPRIMKIEPGGEAVIRLGFRGKWPMKEKAYRIFLRELPVKRPGEKVVKMLINVSSPVFVVPERESPGMEAGEVMVRSGKVVVPVKSTGNIHITVKKVSLRGYDPDGKVVLTGESGGWYVLPGRVVPFGVDIPAEGCKGAERFEIIVETEELEPVTLPRSPEVLHCKKH